jgi:hypothetical protein
MDFVKWQVYLDEVEMNGFHREDYYLAQIAQCIIQANSKNPNSIKLKQFLLQFSKEDKGKSKPTKSEVRNRMIQSRAAWGALLGVQMEVDDLVEPLKDDSGIIPDDLKMEGD